MKPGEASDSEEADNAAPVGDAIGDTAYSERFVLKILLKLANKDTLKEEVNEKSFEDDLCTLWDMTAEKDVVLFLIKHDVFSLFSFAMPVLESPRMIEIIIGITGNMCCHREGVAEFLKNEYFLELTLQYIKTDDSPVLIQVLRLVGSCLYLADEDDLEVWMHLFDNIDYARSLYFIMNNSLNKDLLIATLENFNSLCTYCNIEKLREYFFSQFVTIEALDAVYAAFSELTTNQKETCQNDETERIHIITLQLAMNLVGFDKSPEIYNENRENVADVINQILTYYEKFIEQNSINIDMVDIIDSTNTVVKVLEVSEVSSPDQIFEPSYHIWKMIDCTPDNESEVNEFETDEAKAEDKLKKLRHSMIEPLCILMSIYLSQCTDENLVHVLDIIDKDYDKIIDGSNDPELKGKIVNRAANYRTRLKENNMDS